MVTDWPPSIAIDCVASVAAARRAALFTFAMAHPSPRGASRARARRSCQTRPGASTAPSCLDGATRDTLVSRRDDDMDLMELRDRVAQAVREGRLAGRHS